MSRSSYRKALIYTNINKLAIEEVEEGEYLWDLPRPSKAHASRAFDKVAHQRNCRMKEVAEEEERRREEFERQREEYERRKKQAEEEKRNQLGMRKKEADPVDSWEDWVDEEKLTQCWICLDDTNLSLTETCTLYCCGHARVWHVECLKQIQPSRYTGKRVCPCCKREFVADVIA